MASNRRDRLVFARAPTKDGTYWSVLNEHSWKDIPTVRYDERDPLPTAVTFQSNLPPSFRNLEDVMAKGTHVQRLNPT